MSVYFIQAASGPIKIGKSDSPRSRFEALQTSNHETLMLLLVCDESIATEEALHKKFAALRIRGEWFRPEEALLSHIEQLRARTINIVSLPKRSKKVRSQRVTIRITDEDEQKLKDWAESADSNLSDVVRQLIKMARRQSEETRGET